MSASAELRSIPHWVAWRYENRGGPKPTKPPISPKTGKYASVSNSADWTAFEEASAYAEDNSLPGVGFVLTADDGFTGIDIDNCRDPVTGSLDDWAAEIVASSETYAEVSPSGAGLRLIARGKVPKTTKCDPAGVEIYRDGRYLTITGDRLSAAPNEIREAPRTLELLLARVASFAPPLASAQTPETPIASIASSADGPAKDRFRRVNDAALANLSDWVPVLFPHAKLQTGTGGYRVSSRELGRDRQEELSITPFGIKDFGEHDMGDAREGKRSAIDLVIEWGGAPDAVAAGEWLADRIGVDFKRSADFPPGVMDAVEAMLARAETLANPLAASAGQREGLPTGDTKAALPAAASPPGREELLLAEWLKREIPPRDYLLGNILSTTSIWIIYGETGVGKTLFAVELAGAVASGMPMLNWEGRRPARVMYLDGELPAETFKERMEIIAERYGQNLDFYGYCRDVLSQSDMPAINTPRGEAWLRREVENIKPDLIVFDSIMCLLSGSMSEEESWEPVKSLIRSLTTKRIAQIWLHHTGHDVTKGFGTKTREWEMDTVMSLTKSKDGGEGIALEFTKARLRTPATMGDFQSRLIRRESDGWVDEANIVAFANRRSMELENLKRALLREYDRLAKSAEIGRDESGQKIQLVSYPALVESLKNRGFLETNDKGALTATARTHLRRAKSDLLNSEFLIENNLLIWRPVVITSCRGT